MLAMKAMKAKKWVTVPDARGKTSGKYPPGYRTKEKAAERRKEKEAKMKVLEEKRKKMEEERAEFVRKRKKQAEEAKEKDETEKRKKMEESTVVAVKQALEEAKAAWEFEAVEREKEAFRIGWIRGQSRLMQRGALARGMVAHIEQDEAWQAYGGRGAISIVTRCRGA